VIKGVAFDLEGTLIDVEWAHHLGHFAAASEVGVLLDKDSARRKLPHFIGGPDKKIAEEIHNLRQRRCTVEQILVRTKDHYTHNLRKIRHVAPRKGFLKVLSWFLHNDYCVAIGSLTPRSQANVLLTKSGIRELFQKRLIVLEEDVRRVKPCPDVYLETAKRMGILATEQLVFEDSPNGVAAAVAAGSRAVAMPVVRKSDVYARLWKAGAERLFLDWSQIDTSRLVNSLNASIAPTLRRR
jgi:beta-phosphoglucomutase-like phosphatase (HAD superfamily)